MPTYQDLHYRVTANDAQLDRLIAKTNALATATYGAANASKSLDTQLRAAGRRTTEVGRYLTRNVTQPMLIAAGLATKLGYDFEKSFSRIRTLAGASAQEMEGFRKAVYDLGRTTPTSVNELADALYFVRSSGFRGAEAIRILTAANQAAVAGLGDVKTVADTVTSAMNAYGVANLSASRATDILMATVRVGKAEPEELARAIGRVIPIAAQMGVGFHEVGGAVAAMTLQGLNADLAVTGLRAQLTTFTRGLPITQKGLASLGLSFTAVQKSIQQQGLLKTLNAIRAEVDKFDTSGGKLAQNTLAALEKYGEGGAAAVLKLQKASGNTAATILSQLFPNVRALNSFLILTSKNGRQAAQVMGEVRDSAGETERAFRVALEQDWAKLAVALNRIRTELTKVGAQMLPTLGKLAELVASMLETFNRLPSPLRQVAAQLALMALLAGPVLSSLGLLIRLSSVYVLRRARASKAVVTGLTQEATAATAAGEAARRSSGVSVYGAELATAAYNVERVAVERLTAAQAQQARIAVMAGQASFGGGFFLNRRGTATDPRTGETVGSGQAGRVRPGMFGPGGAPVIFSNIRPEIRPQMDAMAKMQRTVTRLRGGFTALRGAIAGARVALVGFAAAFWPVLAVEGVILLWQNWDTLGKKIRDAENAAKDFATVKLPGGGAIGDFFGDRKLLLPGPVKDFMKWTTFGLVGAARDSAKTKENVKEAAKEAGKNKDYWAQTAKNLGISEAELRRILGLTKGVAESAAKAKAAFEDAFDRLGGDIETAFDAKTDQLTKGFDRATDDMLEAYDDATDKMVEKAKVTVKVMGKTFTQNADQLTPAERELKALEEIEKARRRQRDAFDAAEELLGAMAIGSPHAIREAQRKLEDARAQSARDALEKRAAAERKAVDKASEDREDAIREGREAGREAIEDEREKLRSELIAERNLELRHLQDRLKSLAKQLTERRIKIEVFNTKLRGLMREYGVTASDGAELIGESFGRMLTESLMGLDKTIERYAYRLGNKQAAIASAAESAAKRMVEAYDSVTAAVERMGQAVGALGAGGNTLGGLLPPPAGYRPPTGGRAYPFAAGVATQYGGGPADHAKRAMGNWQSDQAVDIHAKPGSVVLAVAGGTVRKVSFNAATSGNVFGNSITIDGDDGTDWFYTHLRGVFVRKGQHVKAGMPIGTVSKWQGGSAHVHIGASSVAALASINLWPRTTRTAGKRGGRQYTTPAHRAPQGLLSGAERELQSLGAVGGALRPFMNEPGAGGLTAGGTAGLGGALGALPGIGAVPQWLRPGARKDVKAIANRIVRESRLAARVAKGYRPTRKDWLSTIPKPLDRMLSGAERRKLGPDKTKEYLQWLAGVQASPYQYGLVKTQPNGPDVLGRAGQTGNVGPITINIYGATRPRETAVAVRDVLQKTSRRNARQTRGRNAGQVVGLR